MSEREPSLKGAGRNSLEGLRELVKREEIKPEGANQDLTPPVAAEKKKTLDDVINLIKKGIIEGEMARKRRGEKKSADLALRDYKEILKKSAGIIRDAGEKASIKSLQEKLEDELGISVGRKLAAGIFNYVRTNLDKEGLDSGETRTSGPEKTSSQGKKAAAGTGTPDRVKTGVGEGKIFNFSQEELDNIVAAAIVRAAGNKASPKLIQEEFRKAGFEINDNLASVLFERAKAKVSERPESEEKPDQETERVAEEIMEDPEFKRDVEEAAEAAGIEGEIDKSKLLLLKERIKGFGKIILSGWKRNWKEFVAGGAAGAAVRTAVRLSFGSSLGLGIAAGAVAGATSGGVREYISQRKKFTAESILEEIKSASDDAKRAAALAKAKEVLDKTRVSGSKEDVEKLADIVREGIVLSKSKAEMTGSQSEKEKIINILKIAEGVREEVPKAEGKRKEILELIEQVEFQKGEIDRKKIARAMVKGAVIGAVGGAVGGAISSWISDHFFAGGGRATQEVVSEARKEFSLVRSHVLSAEIAGKAVKKSLEESQQRLSEKIFHVTAEKGDGLTHLARRAVHDFLVNQKSLNPDAFKSLSVEQLVYSEDTLVKKVTQGLMEKGNSTALNIGEEFTFTGEEIENTLSKASSLSPDKIESLRQLLQDPEHLLSDKTRSFMTDWSKPSGGSSDFVREAAGQARETAQKAVEEAVNTGAVSVEDVLPPPSKGTNSILENICYQEEMESLPEAKDLPEGIGLSQQTVIEQAAAAKSGNKLSGLPRLRKWGPIVEEMRESVPHQDLTSKANTLMENLANYSKSPSGAGYLENFVRQNGQDLLNSVSEKNYSIPGKSLLDKDLFIQQFRGISGGKNSTFFANLINALEHSPDYLRSVGRFRNVIQSCGFDEKEFAGVANDRAVKFMGKYGGEKVGFFARAGLGPEELGHRQKLVEAMKKMMGDGTIGGKKVDLSKFKVSDFVKFFV